MPTLPPLAAAPYDTVTTVLNSSRVRLNDAISSVQAVSGKLVENNQQFTLALVNTAWRKLQEFLANLGFAQLRQEGIIFQLPVISGTDASLQQRIDWFNFFDGGNLYPAPVLPPDLMFPLRLWERQSGTAGAFVPMEAIVDGLPNFNKQARNGYWEWRADGIYLPGATQTVDLRIRYARYLPDFADTQQVLWFQQSVPMMRSSDAFSYFICAEVAEGRDELDPDAFRQKGEAAAKLMMNRDVAMKQRINIRRQSRSGRLEGFGNGDYGLVY